MLGYRGRLVKRGIVSRWFICVYRQSHLPSGRMKSWSVLNDAVLEQDEGFVRGLFSVEVFVGVMQGDIGGSGG